MHYILQASHKAFIIKSEDEIIVTEDYTRATQYNIIGEAMKAASEVNQALGTNVVKLISVG